jgi:hypothetical protein
LHSSTTTKIFSTDDREWEILRENTGLNLMKFSLYFVYCVAWTLFHPLFKFLHNKYDEVNKKSVPPPAATKLVEVVEANYYGRFLVQQDFEPIKESRQLTSSSLFNETTTGLI